jgi:dTDP-4-amino-4,6-dideoxygalactose transaminase
MMIPLAVPNLEGNEATYLQECIRTTFVSSVGPFVDRFAAMIAEESGAADSAVLCSGTVALQMAIEALGIGQGDTVICPSLSFIATANAIHHSGARPWFIDSSAADWAVDIGLLRDQILTQTDVLAGGMRVHRATGLRVRAIMPVMIMGATLDFDALTALAREFGLHVVVDGAAAIGARASGDRRLCETGVDAVCYSFNGNKTVTCGGGGAVASSSKALIARIRHLTTTGRVGRDYDHDIAAYNFRMTNVQAAIGVAQMERLGQFLTRKAQIAARYAALAADHPSLSAFPTPDFGLNTHWFSGFYLSDMSLGADRVQAISAAFRAHMVAAGIDLRCFWKPLHLQAPHAGAPRSPMPVAEDLWQRIYPLPCSTHLPEADLDHVLRAAGDFWHGTGWAEVAA